jgi:nucleoside-diphosphate-sugar epimerase
MTQSDKILIIGYGYIGQWVARQEQARGNHVAALVRSDDAAQRAQQNGVEIIRGDLDNPDSLRGLSLQNRLVYYFAPPNQTGTEDLRVRAFTNLLAETNRPAAMVYISTTGVYGHNPDEWTSEEARVNPASDRARRRLDAEQRMREWAQRCDCRIVILRVAGIYGPQRLPVERLRRREPMVDDPGHPGFINVIHAEDLVAACLAAADRGKNGEAYNVCDGHPASMMQYFTTIAKYLDMPPPRALTMTEAEQQLSPGMLSYVREARKLSNTKLVEELGVQLRYPTMEEGIAAIVRSGQY